MNKYKVGIVGFTGYSGAELVRLLGGHPQAQPVLLEHRHEQGVRTEPINQPQPQGERVDYAQLVKIYTLDMPEDARRYAPPRLAEAIPTPIYGDPEDAKICTSHVERQNLTMRMCMRRLTRLTNGFSKKLSNLKAALALHFAWYNFCRKHMALKGVTPAMAAGLTDHRWTLGEVLG